MSRHISGTLAKKLGWRGVPCELSDNRNRSSNYYIAELSHVR
jgi:hypothetical protein